MGLHDDPFTYQVTKSGAVRIFRSGRVVATVGGATAGNLVRRLGRDPDQDQHLLARTSGHYRQGNERMGRSR